jgi:hypothetical protein
MRLLMDDQTAKTENPNLKLNNQPHNE